MLGYESERRLKNLLICLGEGERDLEVARQKLSIIPDFALHSAFQRIDRDQNGFITCHEIFDFLRENQCFQISVNECFAILQFFDNNSNNMLSFQEFIQMILPCEDNILRNVVLDRPSRRLSRYDILPKEIEYSIVNVIVKEADLLRKIEILKTQLHSQFDFSPLACFRSLDKFGKGKVDDISLGAFLRQLGYQANELELLAIIRRIDTDGDASITYEELMDFLKPVFPLVQQIVEVTPVDRNLSGYGGARNASPIRNKSAKNFSPTREQSPLRSVVYSPSRLVTSVYGPERGTQVTTSYIDKPFLRPNNLRVSPQKKPILNIHQEDELVHALKEQCNLEQELETAKIQLAQKQDFNLFDAFNIFDVHRLGSISLKDLQNGLNQIGIFPTFDECQLFFQRYDENKNGRLSFEEFSKAFIAFDRSYSEIVQRRVQNYVVRVLRREDIFFPSTANQFRSMLKTHFRVENAAEYLRQRLNSNPGFNAYEAFNSLDLFGDGSITPEEIKRILESRGYFVGYKEALQVVSKYDKKRNGKVTFQDFQEESRNKSPVRR